MERPDEPVCNVGEFRWFMGAYRNSLVMSGTDPSAELTVAGIRQWFERAGMITNQAALNDRLRSFSQSARRDDYENLTAEQLDELERYHAGVIYTNISHPHNKQER